MSWPRMHPGGRPDAALEQGLRPWADVAAEYNRRSGERLPRSTVYLIGCRAMAKIRRALGVRPAAGRGGGR